jgi:hypothetical protein
MEDSLEGLREAIRKEVRNDPLRAIALAMGPVTELWVAVLEAVGHPKIDAQKRRELEWWAWLVHRGVDEAILAAACEMRLRSGVWPEGSLREEPRPRQHKRHSSG